jgi:hypothetical protein
MANGLRVIEPGRDGVGLRFGKRKELHEDLSSESNWSREIVAQGGGISDW